MVLPQEIISDILVETKDIELSCGMNDEYAIKKIYDPFLHTWNYAAKHNYLELIKWLHVNKKEGCTNRIMDIAVTHGNLRIVEWLYTHRTEGCTSRAITYAQWNEDTEMVDFLLCKK